MVLLLHPENWYDYYYTNWQIYRVYTGCLKIWRLQSELGHEPGILQSWWSGEEPCLPVRASFLSLIYFLWDGYLGVMSGWEPSHASTTFLIQFWDFDHVSALQWLGICLATQAEILSPVAYHSVGTSKPTYGMQIWFVSDTCFSFSTFNNRIQYFFPPARPNTFIYFFSPNSHSFTWIPD